MFQTSVFVVTLFTVISVTQVGTWQVLTYVASKLCLDVLSQAGKMKLRCKKLTADDICFNTHLLANSYLSIRIFFNQKNKSTWYVQRKVKIITWLKQF